MPRPASNLLVPGLLGVALAIFAIPLASRAYAAPGDCTTLCFVDAVNGDDTLHHGTSAADAFKTLQKAANTVAVGGTVRVAPGLYDPNFTEVPQSMTLLGAQAGVDPLTRDPNDASAESIVQSNTGFSINGPEAQVVIDGFTFRPKTTGSSGGVSARGVVSGTTVIGIGADITVENNIFAGINIGVSSIFGTNPSSLTVLGNLFSGGGTGIQAMGDRGDAPFLVDSNTFRNATSFGVSLLVWANAVITNNTIDSPTGTSDPIWVGGCADCTISGNEILSPAAFDAISLFGANGFASTDCTIEDNTITNPTRAANYGIWIGLATGTVIRGNTITGAREAGIATDPEALIEDNVVTSVGGAGTTGIYLRRATAGATVTGNTVSGAAVGIDIDPSAGSANTHINRNSITGNPTGLQNRSMTTVDATCNWWGDASGPSGQGPGSGDPVSAAVTFSPWLLGSDLANAVCGVPGTPTPTPTATPTATPTPTPTPGVVEQCGNCIDDDGDALVDRDDPDCPARADGGGAGIMDAKRGKAVAKCQQKLGKAGASFAAKKQKILLFCIAAVQKCLQQKAGDAACLVAAQDKCAKKVAGIAALETKLASDLEKSCSALTPEERTEPSGLGFAAEASACAAVGVPSLDSVADLSLCIGRRHACETDRLLAVAAPRARELLDLAGVDPAIYACAIPGADGAGVGLGDASRGKALLKCEKSIEKSSASLVKQSLIGWTGCVAAVAKCVQQDSGDAACLTKAQEKCEKNEAKLDGPKGPAAKALAAIEKGCGTDFADVAAPAGLGEGAVASYCSALGVPSFTDVGDVAECLARDHRCRAGNLLDASAPRALEYLTLGGLVP